MVEKKNNKFKNKFNNNNKFNNKNKFNNNNNLYLKKNNNRFKKNKKKFQQYSKNNNKFNNNLYLKLVNYNRQKQKKKEKPKLTNYLYRTRKLKKGIFLKKPAYKDILYPFTLNLKLINEYLKKK